MDKEIHYVSQEIFDRTKQAALIVAKRLGRVAKRDGLDAEAVLQERGWQSQDLIDAFLKGYKGGGE